MNLDTDPRKDGAEKQLLFRPEWPHFYAVDVLSIGERDPEGMVGKWAHSTYCTDRRVTSWRRLKKARVLRKCAIVTSCSGLRDWALTWYC